MANFNIGDVVVLKSGSPAMTVVYLSVNKVGTQWFDQQQKLKAAEFDEGALDLFKPGEPLAFV